MERSRNGRAAQTATPNGARPGRARQRAVMIAALPDGEDLSELRELLRTAGVATVGQRGDHQRTLTRASRAGPVGRRGLRHAAVARALHPHPV